MMFGTGAMETMTMPSSGSTTMAMDMSSTASMGGMAEATSSGHMHMPSPSSSSSSSSMDMSSDHSMMSMFFTSSYTGVPVLFKTLSAASGGKAFGIFVLLFFAAFAFRGLSFLSKYIEQKVFAVQTNDDVFNPLHVHEDFPGKSSDADSSELTTEAKFFQAQKSPTAKFFEYSLASIYRDFIRLLLTVLSVMFGYALMLAVMSFVVLYFFAVVLGIAFGEIFFMRLSYALNMLPPESVCSSVLH